MSRWPGKYVIGLTGNIATGKSVVRRMLEHLGAYTIDADALSHRAIARGAPAYQPVLEAFGKWVLDKDGEIDRLKLGNLVFTDPAALQNLEQVIHPYVRQAIDVLVKRSSQPVVVIEAIKLLETEIRTDCDSIWVTFAPEEVQVERLMRKRKLSREEAKNRIRAQTPQAEKVVAANVVVRNTGSYDDLWKQVSTAWKQFSPEGDTGSLSASAAKAVTGQLNVGRGRPRNSTEIAGLITRLSHGRQKMTSDDIMAQFGDKAYMLLLQDKSMVGIAGWQVENLVARTTDIFLEPGVDEPKALELLIAEVERASSDLQCEASLVFPNFDLAAHEAVWKKMGYERRTPEALGVQAWTDAALESMPRGTVLLFKPLRHDRVLRPI